MNKLNAYQIDLAERIYQITESVENLDAEVSKELLSQARDKADLAVNEIEDVGAFKGDTLLYSAALSLIRVYSDVINHELTEMVDIISTTEEISDKEELKIRKLKRRLSEKISLAERRYLQAENAFRRKYGLPEEIWYDTEPESERDETDTINSSL